MGKKILSLALLIVAASIMVVVPSTLLSGKTNVDSVDSEISQVDSLVDSQADSQADSQVDSQQNELPATTTPPITTDITPPPDEPEDVPTDVTPTGSIVEKHGMLKVSGNKIVDKNGDVFQMRGMSTHGMTWFPKFVNKSAFQTFRDDWAVNTMRLAMYVDEWGNADCYLKNPDGSKELMTKGIEACLELGIYVIVDWHILNPGDPTAYTSQAKAFFKEFATKYKDYDNIIYEIANEPNGGDIRWTNKIKPYSEEIIKVIRQTGAKNLIIAGTGTWSQDIHDVVGNTLDDDNTAYAFHFYADTHKDSFRQRFETVHGQGLPIIVSEFGLCDASGNGNVNLTESTKWLELMDRLNIGYLNWSVSDKDESASCFVPSTQGNGNWSSSDLTQGGSFVRTWLRKRGDL